MTRYMLVFTPLDGQPKDQAQYLVSIGRSGPGQVGFASTKSFLSLSELASFLRSLHFTDKAIASVESDMKSRKVHIAPDVHLGEDDFKAVGLIVP